MDVHTCDQISDRDVFAVCGELDLAVLTSLPARFQGLLGPPAGRRVGLDLAQVGFIDCAGLRALLAIEDYVVGAGGNVRLVAMSPPVARLLELLELPAGSCFLAAPAAVASPVERRGYPRVPQRPPSARRASVRA